LAGWPIVYDQYQPLELLGKGGFGEVYKCYDLENNQYVALKVNNFRQGDQAQMEYFFKHVQREADIMKKLNHPNICKFMKLLECGGNKVTFTLEYC
jgi:serine/threonine protein kinase